MAAPVPAPLQPYLARLGRSRGGPDGAQRLVLPADAAPLRRQRPAAPAPAASTTASRPTGRNTSHDPVTGRRTGDHLAGQRLEMTARPPAVLAAAHCPRLTHMPNSGRCAVAFLCAGLYIATGVEDRQFIRAVVMGD